MYEKIKIIKNEIIVVKYGTLIYFATKTSNLGAKNRPNKIPTMNDAFPKKLATKPLITETKTQDNITKMKIKSKNEIVIQNVPFLKFY